MKTWHQATIALLVFVSEFAAAAEGFQNVTRMTGLAGLSGGVAAWGDFDNDTWPDLYVDGQLWRNEKGVRFRRVEGLPLAGPGIWGDFDNDGWLDLYSWSGGGKLYRNLHGKDFAATKLHFSQSPQVSLGATSADLDGDGYLDLYVGGYEIWPSQEFSDAIYLNQGGKRFVLFWQPDQVRRARGIIAADYDEDGDMDIYVSNYRLQSNSLWQNRGRRGFRDAAIRLGIAGGGDGGSFGHTIGSAWGDFDNDGHFDLFVGNFSHLDASQDRPQFLRNLGPGGKFHFENKSSQAGLHWQESYASPTVADFDNDGFLDLFLTTVYEGDTSVLYRNLGGWRFEDVTSLAQLKITRTYQAAWADFDKDGYLDLVSGAQLFQNLGGNNNWLKVRLEGRAKSNTSAIGAQVRVRLHRQTLTRQIEGATGQGNQNDLVLHFGLGSSTKLNRIEIHWSDGKRQRVKSSVNRTVTIVRR